MDNQLKPDEPKMVYRSLKLVGAALIAGVLLLLSVFIYLRFSTTIEVYTDMADKLLIVAGILSIPALYIAIFIFSKKYKDIKSEDLSEKLNGYRSIFIIIMALYEGVAIFFNIIYYLTGSYIAMGGALFFIILMLFNFPSLSRISNTLNLSEREIRMLS